jgi:hypothetical protein
MILACLMFWACVLSHFRVARTSSTSYFSGVRAYANHTEARMSARHSLRYVILNQDMGHVVSGSGRSLRRHSEWN